MRTYCNVFQRDHLAERKSRPPFDTSSPSNGIKSSGNGGCVIISPYHMYSDFYDYYYYIIYTYGNDDGMSLFFMVLVRRRY